MTINTNITSNTASLTKSLDALEYRLHNKDSILFAIPRINRALKQVAANLERIQRSGTTSDLRPLLNRISTMKTLIENGGKIPQKQTSYKTPILEKIANLWALTFPKPTILTPFDVKEKNKIQGNLDKITKSVEKMSSVKETTGSVTSSRETIVKKDDGGAVEPITEPITSETTAILKAAAPLLQKYKEPINKNTQHHINAILDQVKQIPKEQRAAVCQATVLLSIKLPIKDLSPLLAATASIIKDSFEKSTILAVIGSLIGEEKPIDLCKRATHLIKDGMDQKQVRAILLFTKVFKPSEEICKALAPFIRKESSIDNIQSLISLVSKLPKENRDTICTFAANCPTATPLTFEIVTARLNAAACLAAKTNSKNLNFILTHLGSLKIPAEQLGSFCQTSSVLITPNLDATRVNDILSSVNTLPPQFQDSTVKAVPSLLAATRTQSKFTSIKPLLHATLQELSSIQDQNSKEAICKVVAGKVTFRTPINTIRQQLSECVHMYNSLATFLKPMSQEKLIFLLKELEPVPSTLRQHIYDAIAPQLDSADQETTRSLISNEMTKKDYFYNFGTQKYEKD